MALQCGLRTVLHCRAKSRFGGEEGIRTLVNCPLVSTINAFIQLCVAFRVAYCRELVLDNAPLRKGKYADTPFLSCPNCRAP